MIGIQKGTIILTTTHILDAHPIRCCAHTLRNEMEAGVTWGVLGISTPMQ